MSLAVKRARFVATGDPGLFGSIGKFIGGAAKTIGGIIGGPVGYGLRTLGGLVAPTTRGGMPVSFVGPRPTSPAGRDLLASQGRLLNGRLVPTEHQVGAVPVGPAMACPPGMRANKSSYFLRDGTFVPKNSRCVAVRRRNPGNSRANDRAIGRIESAKKMAARLSRITIKAPCPKTSGHR